MSSHEINLYEKFEEWVEKTLPDASEEVKKAAVSSYVYLLLSR